MLLLQALLLLQSPTHRERGKLGSICLCAATGSRRKRAPKTGNVSQLIRRTSSGFGVETAVFPNMNKHVDVKMQMLHKIVEKKTEERESSELTVILSKVSMHIHGF